ncbi:dnaJ [Symbiodinium natans]|uniref:DnaJ protein n=1 Tax=Symbiodinium natans TaxID=878477 RepID=A0A812JAT5_9DINO|nr:dnaJ [Symbiodinium natans]
MYPNKEASRCSFCNRNCAVCGSFSVCDLCFQDTVDNTYVIDETDGSCTEVKSSFFKQYYWWCLSGSIFGGLVACGCLVSICDWLCTKCCFGSRRFQHFNSDSDID